MRDSAGCPCRLPDPRTARPALGNAIADGADRAATGFAPSGSCDLERSASPSAALARPFPHVLSSRLTGRSPVPHVVR
jgi:hypothetical protein